MRSAGDQVEAYLRVARVQMDALGASLEEALEAVPEELREAVRARYEEETSLPIRRVHILSGEGGPRPWFEEWDPSEGYYWRRHRSYLIDHEGWPQAEVESLDDATDRILSHLEDPRPVGPDEFNVRGLVMGYVQSGKTANFCALAAKAADLGYKLVIILSGIHNSLRLQTQRRANRALGVDGSGVPIPEPGRRWIALTEAELHGDFRPGTIGADVLQGNEHVIMVAKKNATVLRRLTSWMGDHAPASLPVLIIDDEADQASINTGDNRSFAEDDADLWPDDLEGQATEEEVGPSAINGLVRSLIASFHRVCYVAYTATPFANILVNHLAIDREVFEDIYPRDFIVALPRPNEYCGAERLFGREGLPGETDGEVPGLDVIEFVPEHEARQLTPSSQEVDSYVPQIPQSLATALMDFVLSIAARDQRGQGDLPASMLVHTHHRIAVQNAMGEAIREHLSELRQAWRYDRGSVEGAFAERWRQRFRPVIVSVDMENDVPFASIAGHIDRLFRDSIPVIVLNSSSEDILDYEVYPTLKAVIVGGNRLSRGLTLEGLLVSYYVRQTRYYDTLMQMGRWFGFRAGHVDLTKIWTTAELAEWFRDLALAEEELRGEVRLYETEGLTPLDFGPRIRSHPAMMVTARNKMGSARRVYQNYSGYMLQTTFFRFEDRGWLDGNLAATERLIRTLGTPDGAGSTPRQPVWYQAPWQTVNEFLSEYKFDPRATHEMEALRQYIQEQAAQDELVEWWISLRGRGTHDQELGHEERLAIDGQRISCIGRTRLKTAPHSIGSLINPATLSGTPGSGDEEVGLTPEQLEAARTEARDTGDFPRALRKQRDRRHGLLLLYPISAHSRPRDTATNRLPLFENPETEGCTVMGMAMVFPVSDSAATIEYVVGSVGAELPR